MFVFHKCYGILFSRDMNFNYVRYKDRLDFGHAIVSIDIHINAYTKLVVHGEY